MQDIHKLAGDFHPSPVHFRPAAMSFVLCVDGGGPKFQCMEPFSDHFPYRGICLER